MRRQRRDAGSTAPGEAFRIVDNAPKPGFKAGARYWYTRHHRGGTRSLIFRAFWGAIEGLQISLAAPVFLNFSIRYASPVRITPEIYFSQSLRGP
jgi:membrane-bound metal-dependent hydrolase YbcI (DUF457 family)